MDEPFKRSQEITGALATVAGIVSLFFTETATAGVLIAAVGVGVLVSGVVRQQRGTYTTYSTRIDCTFMDPRGHEQRMRITKRMRINSDNVSTIWLRNLGADGRMEVLRSNLGRLLPVAEQAGETEVCVVFDVSPPKGSEITLTVDFVLWDSFLAAKEAHTVIIDDRGELVVTIRFPLERTPVTSGAYEVYKSRSKQIPVVVLGPENSILELRCKRPRMGARYRLEWEW